MTPVFLIFKCLEKLVESGPNVRPGVKLPTLPPDAGPRGPGDHESSLYQINLVQTRGSSVFVGAAWLAGNCPLERCKAGLPP